MRTSLLVGVPLLIRTLALRAALLLTTWTAARSGAVALAAHQVGFTIWNFLQYVLDALAIAGQTLIGQALGASRADEARALARRMTRWSLCAGVVLGAATVLLRQPLATLFTPDPAVRDSVATVLVVIGSTLVIASWVTLFDGVLIGAGDGPYLARASLITLAVYAPLALVVAWFAPRGIPGLVWLWLAFTIGFMGARAATLWWRERSDSWLVTG
jgi:MATE efflux family protein